MSFVTFNYDTLLEEALQAVDIQLSTISDYVSRPKYTLFKLHGSIDWRLWVRKVYTDLSINEQPGEQSLILAAPVVGEHVVIDKDDHEPPEARTQICFHLPALAIPTVSKQVFVCPPTHVETLKRIIPKVTKIAIVGWRAGEEHFLKLLKDGLSRSVRVIAACGTDAAQTETYERIKAAGISADFSRNAAGGFTDFVVNRRIEPFLV